MYIEVAHHTILLAPYERRVAPNPIPLTGLILLVFGAPVIMR